MNSQHNKLTEGELLTLISQRVTMDYDSNPDYFYAKIIDTRIEFNQHHNSNTIIKPLNFEECIFNGEVVTTSYQTSGKINFKNCVFNENTRFQSESTTLEGECIFNKNLEIHCITLTSITTKLTVKGSLTLTGKLNMVSDINVGQVIIPNQKIIVNTSLADIRLENLFCAELSITSSIIPAVANLNGIQATILSISKINFLSLSKSKLAEIKFDNINDANKRLIISAECIITFLNLPISLFNKIDISDSIIDKIELTNSNEKDDILNIQKVTVANIFFQKMYNNGLITLRELKISNGGIVSVKSSNLGKTDFINCDFSKGQLEFENSKITEAFFSETDFPKAIYNNGARNYSQAQLAFGQLATAFQKQGDNVRMLEYNSRELEAHYNTINWLTRDIFKKINLWLNFVSNNFGRYWARGILFSFGMGLLFFSFLLISTDAYHLGLPSLDFGLVPAFLKFMNPIRFIDTETLFAKQPAIVLNEWSYFWDFLGRIFVTYGFYQTIQAFRRYGKK